LISAVHREALDQYIDEAINEGWPAGAKTGGRITLVGGGWRAFAMLDMDRRKYPLHVLQGYEITPEHALETAKWVREASESALSNAGLSKTRIANAPLTAQVLQRLIARGEPSVLETAAFMERYSARFPGFGEELAAWLLPSFPTLPERIIVAACLLADVNWRIHPDYRAKACFVTATQANLGGLTHSERVFLAVALAYRYKGAKDALRSEPAAKLLSPEERSDAEALGRALRLGAMISGAAPNMLDKCDLARGAETLTLSISDEHASLSSGPVGRRLSSLATSLGLEPVLNA